jgi:multicomponent Na+:H+ antiporter subunit D
MMGAPMTAGAVSKAWLNQGAMDAGMDWAVWVLTGSSLLNAAYFLPILYRLWLRPAPAEWPHERIPARGWRETDWLLLLPPLATAGTVLLASLFADAAISPLSLARLIGRMEYLEPSP